MLSKSTIKYIQSLQHKKFRDEYNAFTAEGPKIIKELLDSAVFDCQAVYALQEWISNLDDKTLQLVNGKLELIKDFELAKISTLTSPNQVAAVFEKKLPVVDIPVEGKLTLVLDDIRDPGNLGTIIRTADWFGINNIVCSMNTADMYNNKVVQSTMASLSRVNIFYTDLEKWLKENNTVKRIAATLDGKSAGFFEQLKEGILIIGNESNGISPAILDIADEQVTIPRLGEAESLNAAVATGILLYIMHR